MYPIQLGLAHLDVLLPVAIALLVTVGALYAGVGDGPVVTTAVGATVGTLLVAWGAREFLRAVGGGYYCCNHAAHASAGAVVAASGWVVLIAALPVGLAALGRDGTPPVD